MNSQNGNGNVRAIVLSAGQGKRLLPVTEKLPKCLIPVHGRTVLEWQLRALLAAGIREVSVVVGFGTEQVEVELKKRCPAGLEVSTVHNPLFDRSDNLVSCLAARSQMSRDFVLLNGDTLFESGIVRRLLDTGNDAVSMAVSCKGSYDSDDMKVQWTDGLVRRVGKDLPLEIVGGEAIGVSLFRAPAAKLFVETLEDLAARPDGHRKWYLSAVQVLAEQGLVHGVRTEGLRWMEIDTPQDLEHARASMPSWSDAAPVAEATARAGCVD
jgi:choline kinase